MSIESTRKYVEMETNEKVIDITKITDFPLSTLSKEKVEVDSGFLVNLKNGDKFWVFGGFTPMNLYLVKNNPDINEAYSCHLSLIANYGLTQRIEEILKAQAGITDYVKLSKTEKAKIGLLVDFKSGGLTKEGEKFAKDIGAKSLIGLAKKAKLKKGMSIE